MITLKTPHGLAVQVPEHLSEDSSARFDLSELAALTQYYRDNGYVIVKGLLSPQVCDRARQLWDTQIKPSKRLIYRQATAKPETHVFNDKGWVMNPILNIQSVNPAQFPDFRSYVTTHVLAAPALVEAFAGLLGDRPKVVQSMYFEGNSATPEHQDSYYLDSENVGTMAASWIALEDIDAQAGRFFICPKSHRFDLSSQQSNNNIVDNHEAYIQEIVAKIGQLGVSIKAPVLLKGDVLIWNALTIHGSLDSQSATHSRSSITCHAIADRDRFLQLRNRLAPLRLDTVGGVRVHRPKDLGVFKNKVIFFAETRFPGLFYRCKKWAIKWMLKV